EHTVTITLGKGHAENTQTLAMVIRQGCGQCLCIVDACLLFFTFSSSFGFVPAFPLGLAIARLARAFAAGRAMCCCYCLSGSVIDGRVHMLTEAFRSCCSPECLARIGC